MNQKTGKKLPVFSHRATLIRCFFWSGLHLTVLLLIRYSDHQSILSDTTLSIFLIPVGLINCALPVYSFSRLRRPDKRNLIIAACALLNFILYLITLQSLHSQSGSITNNP